MNVSKNDVNLPPYVLLRAEIAESKENSSFQ